MNRCRFDAIAAHYARLSIAVVGDFCLDRYLEIDSGRGETSIETGLPVHNVINVRNHPGAAGTVLNNLVALGVGQIRVIGFCGTDGEGYELRRALQQLPGVDTSGLLSTPLRRTFTYVKPLLVAAGQAPRELNRLDLKNWTPTPEVVSAALAETTREAVTRADAVIVLDQVDVPNTGTVTDEVLRVIGEGRARRPELVTLADSRSGLGRFPALGFKMNGAELAKMLGRESAGDLAEIRRQAAELARRNDAEVFVTLAERGIVGVDAAGAAEHVPALPLRGAIDVVGAGDAVTPNLAAALTAGATLREAVAIANTAASIVIHQLGTTGTASLQRIRDLLPMESIHSGAAEACKT